MYAKNLEECFKAGTYLEKVKQEEKRDKICLKQEFVEDDVEYEVRDIQNVQYQVLSFRFILRIFHF